MRFIRARRCERTTLLHGLLPREKVLGNSGVLLELAKAPESYTFLAAVSDTDPAKLGAEAAADIMQI